MSTALFALTTLLASPARAQAPQGVVVRLEAEGKLLTEAPVIELIPTNGDASVKVPLNDEGQPPDVVAGDGTWAGSGMTDASSLQVQAVISGKSLDGGTVRWEDATGPRDLVISYGWSGIQATTGSAGTPKSQTPQDASRGGKEERRARKPGASSTLASTAPSTTDWFAWLPLAGGSLLALIGFGLAIRNSRPPLRPMRLPRLAEPPLLGPGTPALHRGLSCWMVTPEDRDTLTETLVRTVARHHRVLLILPSDAPEPTTFGGPVYVSRDAAPVRVEDHLIDIFDRPGLPVAVVMVHDAPTPEQLKAYREILDPDVGGIVLSTRPDPSTPPEITVARSDDRFVLQTATNQVVVHIDHQGLVPPTS